MSGDVVLDSVILIDHFNSVNQATAYLSEVGELAAITAITRAEVLTGFDSADVPLAAALLEAARCLQAAAARQHGLRLATRNTKDFPPDRFAFVHVPYEI